MTVSAVVRGAVLCVFAWVFAVSAQAQSVGVVQNEILVLDTERFFSGSMIGQRFVKEYQAEREALIAQNREIEAELRAEEQALTQQRAGLTPEEFRDLADAFDARVQVIRQDNERAARDLESARERAPLVMIRRAQPVLIELMQDTGGVVILDSRQILLRLDVIDITDMAIERVDAVLGDGSPASDPAADDPGEQSE